ncbi:ATP-binding protein [Desulfofundulus thermocisternus]|jgi:DNA replication protein DnaC|uniref:ATP-binding protein n=1 Tax=Desulfofundulus thermocisternus TaxID=42471 RepID=UPI0004889DBC|nr:ATP-binding protein [Desulfofundulus thermocisternus]
MKACPVCNDRGIVIKNNVAFPCSCSKQKAILNRFKEAGLPEGLRSHTFDKFDFKYYSKFRIDPERKITYYELARRTFQAALDFVQNFKKNRHIDGLLITGPVGSGKTYLAACIANALLEAETVLLFVVVPDLLDRLRSTYDQNRQIIEHYSEKDLLDTAREVPLLFLDDLGAHNYTEWAKNKLYSILNYRVNHRLPVIITTNISLENLGEYLGERTASRICQMCWPCRLSVEDDIRMIKRREKLQDS